MSTDAPKLLRVLEPDFTHFFAPVVVTWLYQGIRVLFALQCSVFLAVLIVFRGWIGPILVILGIVVTPVAWFLACLAVRLGLEFLLVVFSINDKIDRISHTGKENER